MSSGTLRTGSTHSTRGSGVQVLEYFMGLTFHVQDGISGIEYFTEEEIQREDSTSNMSILYALWVGLQWRPNAFFVGFQGLHSSCHSVVLFLCFSDA